MDKRFDLGWGNSVAVRSAFLETCTGRPLIFSMKDLEGMNYPPHEGDADLINLTRRVIERQVGPTFNHILLTNGATGGVTIALRAFKKRGYNTAFTRSAPYFPLYPMQIRSAGLIHKTEGDDRLEGDKTVGLIDSPTNPHGVIVTEHGIFSMPVIWDAVYHNRVYTNGNYKPMSCDVITGSYSKLLGVNGLRTGWVATNDGLLYERMKELVTAEYSGLSSASTSILLELIGQFKDHRWWEEFESKARFSLDYNRGEWSKLGAYFGGVSASPIGMFYYSYMDRACKRLMAKSGITWTTGSSLGSTDEYGRFNLGQDCRLIRNAVREVLKNDRIRS